jgi:Permeases of the drug/metabolite transporter (DMT) superfamily
MSKTTLSIFAALFASMFFGGDFIVLKLLMPKYITPEALVLIRNLAATIVFWIIAAIVKINHVQFKDLAAIFGIAALGIGFRPLIYFKGQVLSSPIDSSIIMVSVPILVLIFSHFILKEKITKSRTWGMIIGLVGAVALIVAGHRLTKVEGGIVGNLLLFSSALMQAFYYILLKKYITKYGSFTVTTYLFLFGTIAITPFTYKSIDAVDWKAINTTGWLLIGYVCFIVTIVAYYLNIISLKNIKPSLATSFNYVQPIVASVCAYFVLHENMNYLQIISAVLIIFGGFVILRDESHEQKKLKSKSISPSQEDK